MINRRSILKLLCAAPIAAPVAAAAAMEAPAHGIGQMAVAELKPMTFDVVTPIASDREWTARMLKAADTVAAQHAQELQALVKDGQLSANSARRALGLSPLPAVLPYHAEMMFG